MSDKQVAALEQPKVDKVAHGKIETYHTGYLGAQDTSYVGYIKGGGHIYQPIFIDPYAKIGFTKLYDRKNALVADDIINDRVLPFYEQHDLRLLRVLTDRGTEYCGSRENHEYQLYLAIEDIDHTKIKSKSPQYANALTEPSRTSYTTSLSVRRVFFTGAVAGRPRFVDVRLQHKQNAHGKVLLRKNTHADIH